MKRFLIILFSLAAVLSCTKPVDTPTPPSPDETVLYKPGKIMVKVTESLSQDLERNTGKDGLVAVLSVESLSSAATEIGIEKMERLFADAGRFEPRTRKEGLHLWYQLSFDENKSLETAAAILKGHQGITEVEYEPMKRLYGGPWEDDFIPVPQTVAAKPEPGAPYNDPLLYRQWHYRNDGTEPGAIAGCDINVFPVWNNYDPVREDVIVCVVDGGVDFTHEDLEDNMWHNLEKEGDERFGYNFCADSYLVTPDVHATHVAGTIAAVNNNGTGVCGIAGGDCARGIPGVRIMSCQIFTGDESFGNAAAAIKWGADHGAVISQNSWGYPDLNATPGSVKAAVDYFVKYAGFDENGVQTGPMAGGLVVFAAGNEKKNGSSSEYDNILNVTSIGAGFSKAGYSNWGDFADLAAPGGDTGAKVLSTIPGNRYGWSSGTSMACPHVSGAAALIVSICGGPGFTAKKLRQMLEDSASDISAYNPEHYLGKGLVNVQGALSLE